MWISHGKKIPLGLNFLARASTLTYASEEAEPCEFAERRLINGILFQKSIKYLNTGT